MSKMTAEQLLRLFPRMVEFFRFFISLSAGAILLIATFLHDPPQVPGAKWFVLVALVSFFISFWSFVVAMQKMITAEKCAVFLANESSKEETDREKRIKELDEAKSASELIDWCEGVGRKAFFLGVSSMFTLGVIIVWSWT